MSMMQPFARALAMMEAIAACRNQQEIAALGAYVSRGHGLGKRSGRKVNRNKQTNWLARGVIPGGGERECRRRRNQMAKGTL